MMDQLGPYYQRVWGDIEDPKVRDKVLSFIRASGALHRIKGQSYGLFGGRPLGMLTAVANQDEWLRLFGVNVEHVEQNDIVRLSATVEDAKVDHALGWLETYVGNIAYDGKGLTPDKLKVQISVILCT